MGYAWHVCFISGANDLTTKLLGRQIQEAISDYLAVSKLVGRHDMIFTLFSVLVVIYCYILYV